MNQQWTIVTRDKGGRFFRPVAEAPVGDWRDATEAADVLAIAIDDPSVSIWYVPVQGAEGVSDEDRDNVLDEQGRRFAIRWDAEPKHAFPTPDPEWDALAALGNSRTLADIATYLDTNVGGTVRGRDGEWFALVGILRRDVTIRYYIGASQRFAEVIPSGAEVVIRVANGHQYRYLRWTPTGVGSHSMIALSKIAEVAA